MIIKTLVSSAARLLLLTLALCVATALSAIAETDYKPTIIAKFDKSAKRDCDKITYTISVYTLSDGGRPDSISIADVWPAQLQPASSITFSSTPNVVSTTTLNSTGWNIDFKTPIGTAGVMIPTSYTISFTTTLKPSALTGGDFDLTNQATLKNRFSQPNLLKSNDPATPTQGDATVLHIPVAEVKKCSGHTDNGPGNPTPNCLNSKVDITCGPRPGTYTITLHPQGVNGVVPSVLQVSTSTPGISLIPANAEIAVVGGVAHVTVVGASPGQAISLDVMGSATGQGSSQGLDQCCNGKIEIIIPKDLDCDKPRVTIEKLCEPAVLKPGPTDKPFYEAHCKITVKSDGNIATPIHLTEIPPAGATITAITPPVPWLCAPATPTSSPVGCDISAANFNALPGHVSTLAVVMSFNTTEGRPLNCATIDVKNPHSTRPWDEKHPNKSCSPIKFPPHVKVEKTCEPAKKGQGHSFEAHCKITVTADGPATAPINFSELLSGGGQITAMSANPAATVCTPSPVVAAGTPVNCVVPAGPFNANGNSATIDVTVKFNTPGNVNEAKNCARLVDGLKHVPSCDDFRVDEGKIDIKKVCDPAVEIVGAINHYEAKCHITVTTTGPVSGTISVNDALTGNGTLTSISAPAPWTCASPNCSVNGTTLNQTSSTSVIEATVSFNGTGAVSEAKNCAKLSVNGAAKNESCTEFTVVNRDMYVKKVVVNHAPLPLTGMIYDITSNCTNTTQPQGFAHFTDGQTIVFHHYEAGMSCTLSEVIPPTTACGALIPSWTTTYSPSQTVALSPNGETVTVTNTLDCKPTQSEGGLLSIKKEVISHAELPLGAMQFSITANCTGNPTPTLTQQLGDGETKPFQSFAPGTSCTVQEGPVGPTNACGLMTPQWTTEYIPPTALTNFQNGGTVIVRNTLDCICPHDQKRVGAKCVVSTVADPVCAKSQHLVNHQCVDNPPPPRLQCDAATATPAGDLCRCRFDHMTQTSKTACQCQQGYKLQAGRGCEKIIVRPNCKPPQVYNPATNGCITPRPICKPPKTYNKATNSCVTPRPVCGPDQSYNAKRNICVDVVKRCPQGTINLRGVCIEIPHCPRGTIAMPGTGICLPLGRKPQVDGPVGVPQGGAVPGLKIPGL